jgi:twitching motility two-component system response regulator PilH
MAKKIQKVLVVDDSDVERKHVSNILQGAGYTVIEAVCGEDAVPMAISQMPDLILMDVMMPGLNGFQVTRHLKKTPETSAIPIFMLTSRNETTDNSWAYKQGANRYLTKPANASTLLSEINSLDA